jgi:hypothetical protein
MDPIHMTAQDRQDRKESRTMRRIRAQPNVVARGLALFCLGLVHGGGLAAYDGPYPAELLQAKLLEVARTLRDCHLVVVTRQENRVFRRDGKLFVDSSPEGGSTQVSFFEVWLSGDDAQIQMRTQLGTGPGTAQPWWSEVPMAPSPSPLQSADLLQTDRFVAFLRGNGEHLFAEFRPMPPTRPAPTPGLYSRSRSHGVTSEPFVPLVGLQRSWRLPRGRGGWPVVDLLAERPLAHWRVVRTEMRDNKELLYVEVASQDKPNEFPLKTRRGTLAVWPIWKVWFSLDERLAPVRLEDSARYVFDGREFPLEYEKPAAPLIVYEASDFFQIRPGVWFPRSGKQEQYRRSPDAPPSAPFDPDRLVDKLLAQNRKFVQTPYVLANRKEWRVLSLTLIPPRDDLWVDPPDGVSVHDLNTDRYHVQGKTDEESDKILGIVREPRVPREGGPALRRHIWPVVFVVLNAVAICAFLLRRLVLRKHPSK